ncbi:MAG: hypothetical protein SVR81_07990 [Chloroflexota bacterium]|nr:hypothetical protein [Chloroflexota bacterium]
MFRYHRIRLLTILIITLGLTLPRGTAALPAPSMSIRSPGDGATVTSPIAVSAEMVPGADGLVRLALIDQRNNTLSRRLLRIDSDLDTPIPFTASLPFELPGPDTEALLTLSTQDIYHRPLALRSVLLTLTTSGEPQVASPRAADPWLEITFPEPLDILTGGQFTVRGSVKPITDNPVIFELITDSGGVIGSAQLAVSEPGKTAPFEQLLSYGYINKIRDVRLVVRQTIDGYGANVVLDSLLLALLP